MKAKIENSTVPVNPQELFNSICLSAKNRDKNALKKYSKTMGAWIYSKID